MLMKQQDTKQGQPSGAPGEQKEGEIVAFKPKGKFGAGGPPGNLKGLKHRVYSPRLTPEEEQELAQFESDLLADLGGEVSTAQRALIRRASWLEIRLRRCERADKKRLRIADEHILSWIGAQRLLLCALGLERKQQSGPTLQEYLAQKRQNEQEKVQ